MSAIFLNCFFRLFHSHQIIILFHLRQLSHTIGRCVFGWRTKATTNKWFDHITKIGKRNSNRTKNTMALCVLYNKGKCKKSQCKKQFLCLIAVNSKNTLRKELISTFENVVSLFTLLYYYSRKKRTATTI